MRGANGFKSKCITHEGPVEPGRGLVESSPAVLLHLSELHGPPVPGEQGLLVSPLGLTALPVGRPALLHLLHYPALHLLALLPAPAHLVRVLALEPAISAGLFYFTSAIPSPRLALSLYGAWFIAMARPRIKVLCALGEASALARTMLFSVCTVLASIS